MKRILAYLCETHDVVLKEGECPACEHVQIQKEATKQATFEVQKDLQKEIQRMQMIYEVCRRSCVNGYLPH